MTALKSTAIFSAISWICSPTVRIFSTISTISLKKLSLNFASYWLALFQSDCSQSKNFIYLISSIFDFLKSEKSEISDSKILIFQNISSAFIRYPRRYLLFISPASYSYKNNQKFGSSRFKSGSFRFIQDHDWTHDPDWTPDFVI